MFQTHRSLASDASERIKSPLVSFHQMKRRFKTPCGFHGDFLAIVLFFRGGFLVAVMSPRKESDSLHGVYVRLWPLLSLGLSSLPDRHTLARACAHTDPYKLFEPLAGQAKIIWAPFPGRPRGRRCVDRHVCNSSLDPVERDGRFHLQVVLFFRLPLTWKDLGFIICKSSW